MNKILISTCREDSVYAEAFVHLLEALGVVQERILCRYVAPYEEGVGDDALKWMTRELKSHSVWAMTLASSAYTESSECLVEFGVLYALAAHTTVVRLDESSGDNLYRLVRDRGAKLDLVSEDDAILKHHLQQLAELLAKELEFQMPSHARWESIRTRFLKIIRCDSVGDEPHGASARADGKQRTMGLSPCP